jgi:hypothetical protein
MLIGGAANTKLTVSGLTRPGIQPMIYWIRGKHANHYTTNADVFLSCISALLTH